MEDEAVSVKLEGMSCIRTSLESCYNIVIRRQDIDNLTFPLITPLESEDDIYFLHQI